MGKPQQQRAGQLADAIEADLQAGHYRAGEWLKQADVEERYGAHRFDVRMALLELRTRHLLTHVRHRGYRVADPSQGEREDLVQVRTILETAAVRLAAERITEQDIARLGGIVEEFGRHMEDGDQEHLRALNVLFHDTLYQTCGNPLLAAQIKLMRQRGLPGRGNIWGQAAAIRRSHQDHLQTLRLLARRDAQALAVLTEEHLNRWRVAGQPADANAASARASPS